ncbi:MAG: alpha/beta fold hydrolase [Alphaproteobacteria bacterium]
MNKVDVPPENGLQDLNETIADPPAWLVAALGVPRKQGEAVSDGCTLRTYSWGDPAKPGLILLHGFLAHSRCFGFIAPFLAKDYHVVTFDFSGMGDSGTRHIYPDDLRVAEVVDVAEQSGLFANGRKPTIIAHSYGGGVGLHVMEAASEKFAGLVVCDLMTMRPERLQAHFENRRPPGSQDPNRPNKIYPDFETAKGRFVLSPPQPCGVPALFDYMAYHSLQQVEGGYSWKFDPSVFRREDVGEDRWMRQGERLVAAPGRMAIVYGEDSVLFNDDSAAYVRELGGKMPIIGIPHAGHHLMLDQPIAFVAALRSILALWA